jgi:hypothetical protein
MKLREFESIAGLEWRAMFDRGTRTSGLER